MMGWLHSLIRGRGKQHGGDGSDGARIDEGGNMGDAQQAVRAAQERRAEKDQLAREMVRRMKTVDAQIEAKLGHGEGKRP